MLASASPRRQLFLQELGLKYSIFEAHGAEPQPNMHEDSTSYAKRAAKAKAQYVAKHFTQGVAPFNNDYVVISADTVVSVMGQILGKPKSFIQALEMLKLLAGKSHTVISAVNIIFVSAQHIIREIDFFDSTEVTFHAWSEDILAAYAQCGESFDKAGGYAIQGRGAFLIDSISGSWSTVVGLPVNQLVEILLKNEVITTTS